MTKTNDSSPVLGIGNDIIEISRIRKAFDHHGYRFVTRLFTTKEQDYCLKYKDPAPHFAARFSAKEAVVKALGTGFGEHASWLDIEILNNPLGKPYVEFSDDLNTRLNHPKVLITISHSEEYVSTVAIWIA